MLLRCTAKFGNFVPGDEVEVPNGALFDHKYFEAVPQPDKNPKKGEK